MPDGFQAEPPRSPAQEPSPYDRYSEVNLRRPAREATSKWVTIAAVAAVLSIVFIAALVGVGVLLLSWSFR
jgi:hypothetical protein